MRCHIFPLFISFFFTANAFAANIDPEDTSKTSCYEHAEKRLMEALRLMQKHYYKKDAIKWDSLIEAARSRLFNAASCEEAFETVNWCFRTLSETHSFLMPAPQAAVYTNDPILKESLPLSRVVGSMKTELMKDHGIAYLSIPWISTSDDRMASRMADSIQGEIERLDQPGIRKWIIDLRENSGGNCWPMLAGLGPLLGEETCGFFVSGTERLPIRYYNGAAMQGRYIRCEVSRTPYKTKLDKKWIIILTGAKTSSSGEIVALAFKGKEQSVLFGEPTAGKTTANASYPLSDKSLLVLTVCQEADRFGNICNGPIMPDQLVSSGKTYGHEDPVMSAAIMWLHMQ